MPKACDEIGAFVDGELEGAALDAFRDHLIECAECQAELAELMQLRAAEEVHGKLPLRAAPAPTVASTATAPRQGGQVVPLAWWRRRRVPLAITATAMAAAAVVLLVVLRPSPPVLLAEASSRSFEPRLAYAPIDRYRPYEVTRAEGPRGEPVSFEAMARLQRRHDTLGLVAGHLLLGERAQAETLLAAAPRTPELDVARAAAALAAGHPDAALALTDGVLAAHPRLAPALWNRALAERDLHLELAAAADFEAVAALGEPGWHDEAQQRAAELRRAYDARKSRWAKARPAGEAMVRTGQLPSPALVRAVPDYLRLYLFFATVSADSRARLEALRPLAVELDLRDGGHVLAARVDHYLATDAQKRAPLTATFHRLFEAPKTFAPAELDKYLPQLERAGEGELAMAAILRTSQLGPRLAMFTRLAKASGDPYLVARGDEERAMQAIAAADFVTAERVLTTALAVCDRHHLDYRGVALRYALADVYRRQHRTADAEAVALQALDSARLAAFPYEDTMLVVLADVARLRDDFAPMFAYLREAGLRHPDDCETQRYIHESRAAAAVVQLDMAAAARELGAAPSCPSPPSLQHIDLEANLVRAGQPAPAMAQDVVEARKGLRSSGERAFADVVEARGVIDRDTPAGAALLARALAATANRPEDDTDSLKARSAATLTLAVDAARRGAWDDALARLAEDAQTPLPSGCVLGVAVDNTRALAVARLPGKPARGAYQPSRHSAALLPEELVPPSLRAELASCTEVAVLAPPPVNGLARILPPEIAWAYVMGPQPSPPPANASSPRRLIVSDVEPPPSLGLPRLAAWTTPATTPGVVWLRGTEATPARVLDELAVATEAEIHAHGLVDLSRSDASLIVLTPEAHGDGAGDGRYALTARQIRARPLAGHPVVILAACHAAKVAAFYHQPWSLPFALVAAGARAVLAAPDAIPDAQAGAFFDDVMRRIRDGKSPAQALRDARVAVAVDERMHWTANVLVFE